jgi:DNA-binding LacI/PurR family transcriptional regulator
MSTQRDIAESVGVSVATVSLVLSAKGERFLSKATHVNVDNADAFRRAVALLVSRGHRRIALLTHSEHKAARDGGVGAHWDAWERWQGYERAVNDAGLVPIIITHPLDETAPWYPQIRRGGFDSLRALRGHPARPTAVCCDSDVHAAGLLLACRLAGIAVPRDLSVIGFGNSPLAEVMHPALTTFRLPARKVGMEAARKVLALIQGETPGDACLKAELAERDSVAEMARMTLRHG